MFLLILFTGLLVNSSFGAEQTAPDFTLKDLYDKEVSLKDFRGKIVLLDFWATWCMPCRMAVPELLKIQRNYGEKGLIILAISLDDRKKCDNQCLLDFKKRQGINFEVLRSDRKVLADYFGSSSIAIPTSIIVDREGKIVSHHRGYKAGLLEEEIKKLL